MKFSSPHHAFAWAFEILDVWRVGSGFDPDPDHLGGGGTGALGAVVLALSVEMVADRHDPGICRQPHPRDREKSWFAQHYIAQDSPRNWSPHEKWLLDRALCDFCAELSDRGLCGRDGCAGRCPTKKGA